MRYFLTKGIIIKKQNWKDSDNLITIFSPEVGKFKAISKSSRKLTSNFIGHLEILNVCNFQIYKTAHYYTITQCQLITSYFPIRNDLQKTLYSLIIIEIFQKSIEQEIASEELFELVLESLEEIMQKNEYELTLEKFKIKLLQFSGSFPEIDQCFFCRKRWETNQKIWLDQYGHLACLTCLNTPNNAINIENRFEVTPFGSIKLLHYLSKTPFKQSINIILTQEEKFQLTKITNTFLQNYLHQNINSEKIISKIRI